jgi:hypothetical protein
MRGKKGNIEKKIEEKVEKKIEEKVENKVKKTKFVSVIKNFVDNEHFSYITKVCEKIKSKDDGFVFFVNADKKEIYLLGDDKNDLHKRSCWLVNRADVLQKLVYFVMSYDNFERFANFERFVKGDNVAYRELQK